MWKQQDLISFEKDIVFWYPGDKENQFYGRIRYSMEEGIYVDVVKSGELSDATAIFDGDSAATDPVLIHAHIKDIGAATLYDGFVKSQEFGSAGIAAKVLYFNHALLGFYSDSPEQELFKSASLYVNGLETWLGVNPFKFPAKFDGLRNERSIIWSRPEPIGFKIDGVGEASIGWTISGPSQSGTQSVASIESKPYLAIEFDTAVHYSEASNRIHSLLDMVETMSDTTYPYESIRFTSASHTRKVGKSGKESSLSAVFIGCRQSQNHLPQLKHRDDALIRFCDIADFQSCTEKWYALYDSCLPAVRTYTAQRIDQSGYAENRFFLLASIAESLHRYLVPKLKLFEQSIPEDKLQAVVDEVPDDAKEIVNSKLRFLNAPNFSMRLKGLIDDADLIASDVIGDEVGQSEFSRQVKDWRNEQAHQNKVQGKYVVRDGIDFVRTAAKLKVLIDFQILLQLGIDPELIAERMRSCRRYWYYASNQTWPWQMSRPITK